MGGARSGTATPVETAASRRPRADRQGVRAADDVLEHRALLRGGDEQLLRPRVHRGAQRVAEEGIHPGAARRRLRRVDDARRIVDAAAADVRPVDLPSGSSVSCRAASDLGRPDGGRPEPSARSPLAVLRMLFTSSLSSPSTSALAGFSYSRRATAPSSTSRRTSPTIVASALASSISCALSSTAAVPSARLTSSTSAGATLTRTMSHSSVFTCLSSSAGTAVDGASKASRLSRTPIDQILFQPNRGRRRRVAPLPATRDVDARRRARSFARAAAPARRERATAGARSPRGTRVDLRRSPFKRSISASSPRVARSQHARVDADRKASDGHTRARVDPRRDSSRPWRRRS